MSFVLRRRKRPQPVRRHNFDFNNPFRCFNGWSDEDNTTNDVWASLPLQLHTSSALLLINGIWQLIYEIPFVWFRLWLMSCLNTCVSCLFVFVPMSLCVLSWPRHFIIASMGSPCVSSTHRMLVWCSVTLQVQVPYRRLYIHHLFTWRA